MKMKRLVGGNLESNTYIIYQKGGTNCLIIDPGYNAEAIAAAVEAEGLVPQAIVLTHCHHDHIGAAEKLKAAFGCKAYIHREDMDRCADIADIALEDGDTFDLDGEVLRVIHTPGHTNGGICLYSERSKLAFTGDTLFNIDLGRTDLEGGSEKRLRHTCREIIDKWANDITVYPGHGDSCTMKFVRSFNEEFKKAVKPDIRLVALDLDGTTLTADKALTERTQAAFTAAIDKGVQIVVATGRAFSSIPENVLRVKGMEYIVTGNGATVLRLRDRKLLYSNFLDAQSVDGLMEIFRREGSLLEVFTGGTAYIQRSLLRSLDHRNFKPHHIAYIKETRTPQDDIFAFMRAHQNAIENINILFESQEERARMRTVLEHVEDVTVTTSFDHNLEVGGKTTSKGDGIRFLTEMLNLRRENVMACGDGLNDVKLFEFAGLPVAVDNAKPELKALAKFVTASNEEDGVAKAIEKFAL